MDNTGNNKLSEYANNIVPRLHESLRKLRLDEITSDSDSDDDKFPNQNPNEQLTPLTPTFQRGKENTQFPIQSNAHQRPPPPPAFQKGKASPQVPDDEYDGPAEDKQTDDVDEYDIPEEGHHDFEPQHPGSKALPPSFLHSNPRAFPHFPQRPPIHRMKVPIPPHGAPFPHPVQIRQLRMPMKRTFPQESNGKDPLIPNPSHFSGGSGSFRKNDLPLTSTMVSELAGRQDINSLINRFPANVSNPSFHTNFNQRKPPLPTNNPQVNNSGAWTHKFPDRAQVFRGPAPPNLPTSPTINDYRFTPNTTVPPHNRPDSLPSISSTKGNPGVWPNNPPERTLVYKPTASGTTVNNDRYPSPDYNSQHSTSDSTDQSPNTRPSTQPFILSPQFSPKPISPAEDASHINRYPLPPPPGRKHFLPAQSKPTGNLGNKAHEGKITSEFQELLSKPNSRPNSQSSASKSSSEPTEDSSYYLPMSSGWSKHPIVNDLPHLSYLKEDLPNSHPDPKDNVLILEDGTKVPMISVYREIFNKDYFHRLSTRKSSVKTYLTEGTFLLRPSSSRIDKQPLTLCAVHLGRFFSLSIMRRDDGKYAFGKEKKDEQTFPTVDEMIEFHKKTPIKLEDGTLVLLKKSPHKSHH